MALWPLAFGLVALSRMRMLIACISHLASYMYIQRRRHAESRAREHLSVVILPRFVASIIAASRPWTPSLS